MRLLVSRLAEEELDEAITWYSSVSPALGERFASSVKSAFEKILAHPERYNFSRAGTRRFKLHRFPYHVHYVIELTMIHIIAVFHERKDSDVIKIRI